jgi:hypothetical protein
MFKSKTVFIVGAGASCEAGLPSGEALKSEIAARLNIRYGDYGDSLESGDIRIIEALKEASRRNGTGGNINIYLPDCWRISDVVPTASISIDNFIDAHRGNKSIELCGKLGIVKSILDAEHKSKLAGTPDDPERFLLKGLAGSWYLSFLQMLTEGVSRDDIKSISDNVSIITFNYDRCIERFLVQGIADYYAVEASAAQDVVKAIPIYHPYGSLGPLPWQSQQGFTPFGSQRVDLNNVAAGIKTFTEGMDDDDELTAMRSLIANADTVVFLGFAFHPLNMELLTSHGNSAVTRVFATSLGLSKSDETVISEDILRFLGKDDLSYMEQMQLQPEMEQLTCGEFFKYFFRSLTAPAPAD